MNSIHKIQEKFKIRAFILKLLSIWEILKRHYGNVFHTKHITIDVAELFFQHNGENDFLRYDMIIRLLAIENHYGKNDYGMKLYSKMQTIREEAKLPPSVAVERFEKLIKSYEENGYDTNSEIELDSSLHLIDGSHRMAMAMYYGQQAIRAKVRPYTLDVYYRIEWFKANDFTEIECSNLNKRYQKLKSSYSQPFICTLWHPAKQYFNEITHKLSLFGMVTEVKDFQCNPYEYKFLTKGIYAVDDIEKWKIEKKVRKMMQEESSTYSIRMVCLNLSSPDFRLKQSNNKTLSRECEIIKKIIRSAYKPKIENYFHDIIMHIGDNFYQNRHIYRLMTMPPIDVKSILEKISVYPYVATKTEVPYMPTNFPESYPLGKDIDIFCPDKIVYKQVVDCISQETSKYKECYIVRKVIKGRLSGHDYRTQIRIEQEGHVLVFLFDIAYKTNIKSELFVKDLIDSRTKWNKISVPAESFEILIRLQELHDNPKKTYHKDYVVEHKESIDSDLCKKYLKFNWKKFLEA